MIRSVGLDIVDISRIERDITRFGDRFVHRLLGPQEQALFDARRDKGMFLAGRLAAKEAVIKGLAPYLKRRPPFRTIEIVKGPTGAPELCLSSSVQQQLGTVACILSLSHEKKYAVAVAIFTEGE